MRIRSAILPAIFLAFGAIFTACGGGGETETDPSACPDGGTDLTYDNFGKAFFETHCTSCHSETSGVVGADSAPFTTLSQIQAEADGINSRAGGTNDNMPPNGGPTAEERNQLAEWLACGAK
jgi:uncharacterized membrane protein